eukprot:jgi/Hompol1/2186/HPOL_005880-RA
MGKTQRRRRNGPRAAQSSGSPASHANGDASSSASAGASGSSLPKPTSFPVLGKLKSEDANERAWAATTVSQFVQDEATRKRLISGGLYTHLIALLTDAHNKVVLESLGAIANLIDVGAEDTVQGLVHAGILEPMQGCFHKVIAVVQAALASGNTHKPARPSFKVENDEGTEEGNQAQKDAEIDDALQPSPYDLAEQLLNVSWSLGEFSNEFVSAITRPEVVAFALQFLDPMHSQLVPWPLMQVAAQFLNMLTDNNAKIQPIFLQSRNHIDTLLLYLNGTITGYTTWDSNKIRLPVLCASILENIKACLIQSGDKQSVSAFYEPILK